jgi:hypothetical protein
MGLGKDVDPLARRGDGVPEPALAPGDRRAGVERAGHDRDVAHLPRELEALACGLRHVVIVPEAPGDPRFVEH